ncbi:MAG TPA: hypothetical protein VGG35_09080 [Streptosporangiaceae bacterium]
MSAPGSNPVAGPAPAAGGAEAVLITGVYGAGKSSAAAEVAYLLEQHRTRYALIDLDFLGWADTGAADRAGEVAMMLANLAAVTANYRRAGVTRFVLAWFARTAEDVQAVAEAIGMPLRVARLTAGLAEIERRLGADVTSGRRDDLREAAASIAAGEGAGIGDVVIDATQPVGMVARDVLAFLGWPGGPAP